MPEVLVTIGLLIGCMFIGILLAQSDSASSRVSDVNSAAPETDRNIKGH